MPRYDYSCFNCETDYEKERSIHDEEPEYLCDMCGNALNRIFGGNSIQFKGKGFYSTDN